MKKLLLILLCLPMIGFGQGWINYYNDVVETGGVTIRQTTDLGYLILGGNLTSTQHISLSNNNGELLKVTDLLGRETNQTNQPLFYIYDDGTVEKRIVIE